MLGPLVLGSLAALGLPARHRKDKVPDEAIQTRRIALWQGGQRGHFHFDPHWDNTKDNAKLLHGASLDDFNTVDPHLRACMLKNSFSQFAEDLKLLPYLEKLHPGKPGTYVEIGAFQGVKLSNTIGLEHCAGWKGLLIEGNPGNCDALNTNMRYRPNSVQECMAVCDADNSTVSFTKSSTQVAGMVDTMSDSFKNRWHRHEQETVEVPCTRMTNLMSKHGYKDIDLLSLDVEGGEEFVLRASPISNFKIIIVETGGKDGNGGRSDAESSKKRETVVGLIKAAGFVEPTTGHLAEDNQIDLNEVFFRHDVDENFAKLESGAN